MNKAVAHAEKQALSVNGRVVPLQIYYEARCNSRVSITRKGIILRISRYLSRAERLQQVDEFKRWAIKKLMQRPELCVPQRGDFYSGKVIAVRNKSFILDLKFTDARNSFARLNENVLTIYLSSLLSEEQMEKVISKLVSRCVAQAMYRWVNERLCYWNEHFFPQRKYKTLRLRYASSLWGSCSHDGNISISTRLLLAPDEVIDYVLVHELAHLVVPNHSRKFWDLVAKAFPDFEASERWLKQHGNRCDY